MEDLVADRFRIIAVAGRGAFGTVYRALDERHAHEVALKILARQTTDQARFTREAEILARLRHPNVVSYVAHGFTAEGDPYLAMEWLGGSDLAARLTSGPLSVRDALVVALRAAQGLAAAHAVGIVHRDVKPSNLQLAGENIDDVRVIDFGLARVPVTDSPLTASGALLGTPAYMSPEQVRGVRELTAAADVFALGCVLFECLTGAPPFFDPNAHRTFDRVLAGEPPRLADRRPDAPAVLDSLLARMLAYEAVDRLADGNAVAITIAGLLDSQIPESLSQGPVVTQRARRAESVIVVRGAAATEAMIVAHGAEVVQRAPGVLVAVFSGALASDTADRAGACALALRDHDSSLGIHIATRSVSGDRPAADESGVRAGRISLDPLTKAHLLSRYEVSALDELEGPRRVARAFADKLTTPARREAYLYGRHDNAGLVRLAMKLGASAPSV